MVLTPIVTYTKALESLNLFSIPLSLEEGMDYLQKLSQQVILLSLYREYFPAEWTQSTASTQQYSDAIQCSHSPKEMEFLRLVEERLFPIGLEWESVEALEERLSYITVYPHDLDWYQRGIDEFDEFHQFLIHLLSQEFPVSLWQEQFGITPNFVLPVEQLDFEKLETLCRQAPEPLSYLYEVLSIVDHSTNCIWLDSCWECVEYFSWSRESLDFLTEQWKLALHLWDKESRLRSWIEEDKIRYLQLIDLWNQAKKS
ncbi:hypothetical protein [Coleofasciculus chthonoplastes]|uniref:hypothetical protein n=1 Tax=Coleofasciculus chthonoplastes TaxID=64178 RepID=UPI00030CCD99|nr:hypothetical protein [Coleofasciculus chthonoplastes]